MRNVNELVSASYDWFIIGNTKEALIRAQLALAEVELHRADAWASWMRPTIYGLIRRINNGSY